MARIEIVEKFLQDGFFVVLAEHYHEDGSFWFSEHYRWLATEGNKTKRLTNSEGLILMDNGEVAPTRDLDPFSEEQYLPDGREWRRGTDSHMDSSTIWETIKSVHRERTASGAGGSRNVLNRGPAPAGEEADQISGGDKLMNRFSNIVGETVNV